MLSKGAVIVETRSLPNLVEVIKGHMKFLPDFGLTIFCSGENIDLLKVNFPEATIINLGCHVSEIVYNRILTNVNFWLKTKYDKILIFQNDSCILRAGIEQFFDYDYVGAPWKFQVSGGNGGLSLRTKSKMIDVINKYPYNPATHGNEDVYFSNHLELAGGKLAPRDVCEKFSVESIYREGTLGYHAIEKHLTKEQVNTILKQKQ